MESTVLYFTVFSHAREELCEAKSFCTTLWMTGVPILWKVAELWAYRHHEGNRMQSATWWTDRPKPSPADCFAQGLNLCSRKYDLMANYLFRLCALRAEYLMGKRPQTLKLMKEFFSHYFSVCLSQYLSHSRISTKS